MNITSTALIALVFVFAGGVKGMTGMGLPTVAVSLLGLWMPPAAAASLLVLPSLATNLSQCLGPGLLPLARQLWPAWCALAGATIWMPTVLVFGTGTGPHAVLGLVLVVYGAWGLWRPRLPDLSGRTLVFGAAAGLATGAVSAITAVFVMPLVPYLQSLRLGKDEMVQALGLSFTLATLALAVRLHADRQTLMPGAEAAVALLAALAGMWVGAHVRGRMGAATFQRGLFHVFIVLGLANLSHGSYEAVT
ncbi:TSUP family transporter [Piscinibacter koreensis]|uniref:Probable membrane transporter protein n=1 Tax=Piscinibacter koreensis TaxID=2742824 RepID=A0A7Y6NT81_9BURK|nr:TSUP family transporter [Schlegelella koreensis]NUZ08880.1 sulfite exporter TauE/SafE family protein [Schlegelella koreensis]